MRAHSISSRRHRSRCPNWRNLSTTMRASLQSTSPLQPGSAESSSLAAPAFSEGYCGGPRVRWETEELGNAARFSQRVRVTLHRRQRSVDDAAAAAPQCGCRRPRWSASARSTGLGERRSWLSVSCCVPCSTASVGLWLWFCLLQIPPPASPPPFAHLRVPHSRTMPTQKKKAVKRARADDAAADASPKAASSKGKAKAASSKAKASSSSSKKAKPAAAAKKARVSPAVSPLDPANKPSLLLQLSQLTIPELKASLDSNEQSHFGLNKVELIKKIQLCNRTGCVKRCTSCKFGHLKPRKKGQAGSKFVCPGCQCNTQRQSEQASEFDVARPGLIVVSALCVLACGLQTEACRTIAPARAVPGTRVAPLRRSLSDGPTSCRRESRTTRGKRSWPEHFCSKALTDGFSRIPPPLPSSLPPTPAFDLSLPHVHSLCIRSLFSFPSLASLAPFATFQTLLRRATSLKLFEPLTHSMISDF